MTTKVCKISIKDIIVTEGSHRELNPKKVSVLEIDEGDWPKNADICASG